MPTLILIAAATLVSEDLACIAAGVLVAQQKVSFLAGTLACMAGIFAGDLMLFLAGRYCGRPASGWPMFRRFLSEASVDRASEWISRRGAAVVLLSRFVPGLRLPTYFAAGLLRTDVRRFSAYFLVAGAVWTPLLVGATVIVGRPAAEVALRAGGLSWLVIIVFAAAWLGLRRLLPVALRFRNRRRFAGWLLRKVRWEFWPPWAAYLPLIPYLAWLAIRHRSPTLFTAANPGMPAGGFAGESKSGILGHLAKVPGVVPQYILLPAALGPAARIGLASGFLEANGLDFPVVVKPDVGERGSGVAIVRSRAGLESYLQSTSADTILQEYVAGCEVGVFYYRYPWAAAGQVLSITEKRCPEVIGDGRSTLEELILRDRRAVCMASAYLLRAGCAAGAVPGAGEPVRLAEIGSHCRGAVFLDGERLRTAALENAVDRIAKTHPGFFFGRFDIRAASLDDLRAGRSLKVIELNGVSAEAAHIYDPSVSLAQAYRSLLEQWRIAFEIGSFNLARGAAPMRLADFVRLVFSRLCLPLGRSSLPALEAGRLRPQDEGLA